MKKATRVLAGFLLALAVVGCGRYGPPIRAPRPAATSSDPAPESMAPPDERGSVLEDLGQPEPGPDPQP